MRAHPDVRTRLLGNHVFCFLWALRAESEIIIRSEDIDGDSGARANATLQFAEEVVVVGIDCATVADGMLRGIEKQIGIPAARADEPLSACIRGRSGRENAAVDR